MSVLPTFSLGSASLPLAWHCRSTGWGLSGAHTLGAPRLV